LLKSLGLCAVLCGGVNFSDVSLVNVRSAEVVLKLKSTSNHIVVIFECIKFEGATEI